MRALNLGALVHDVLIQQRSATVDASGAPTEGTWTTLVRAQMARGQGRTERGGGEQFEDTQESATLISRWVMRYVASMDPDLVDVPTERRLVYQGRSYDILSAETIDRQVGISLRTLAASKVAL